MNDYPIPDEAMSESEECFRLLVDGVHDYAIFGLDIYGRVTTWNSGAERIKGYTAAEIIGQHFSVFYAPVDVANTIPHAELITAAEEGRLEAEGWRIRKDGSRFWANVIITALYSADKELRGFAKVTRDVTETHRQREELRLIAEEQAHAYESLRFQAGELSKARDLAQQTSSEAQAATLAKSAFLATMSHKIRTPMNAVIGMTELLLAMDLEPLQRNYLETIRSSGATLLGIINDVLDYSKIESGAIDLESKPFELRDLVEGALEMVAVQADAKGIDVVADVDVNCPPHLIGDVTRLRQVLINLLSNAVKFTAAGEVMVTVKTTEQTDGTLLLHVAVVDTGIGIASDRLHRLFHSFSQVDASISRIYGGTGLGLAISAGLVGAMGGRIGVDSELGCGSTFYLAVPTAAIQEASPSSISADVSLAGLHALVVDDNSNNRRILQAQLRSWGMTSDAVDNGRAALVLASEMGGYDIAVLDLEMPAMDGVDLAVALQNLPGYARLPLVLLSSRSRRNQNDGVAEFSEELIKPAKSSHLRRALARAVVLPTTEPVALSGPIEPPPSALRILLAEDNAINQKVALLMLRRLGFEADLANDGLEALAAIEKHTYDVILMDVQMPRMDGLEASRRIRHDLPAYRQPIIIAMTATATTKDKLRCLDAGMDDYMPKPVRMDQLTAALASCSPGGASHESATERRGGTSFLLNAAS